MNNAVHVLHNECHPPQTPWNINSIHPITPYAPIDVIIIMLKSEIRRNLENARDPFIQP